MASMISGFNEPATGDDLARVIQLFLHDQFDLMCGGGVDGVGRDFCVDLDGGEYSITIEHSTQVLMRTGGPPAGKTAFWLDDAEAELIEARRKRRAAQGKKKRRPPLTEGRMDGHHDDE